MSYVQNQIQLENQFMTVKTVFLCDVSIRRKPRFKKHGNADVTVSASYGMWRHHFPLSATSNIIYRKLGHCTVKRFSMFIT